MRTAALDKANYLLRSGLFSDHEVARHAKVSLYDVEREKNRIEKDNKSYKPMTKQNTNTIMLALVMISAVDDIYNIFD
jgi:hypothetical protein